jgi:hypothetical protein
MDAASVQAVQEGTGLAVLQAACSYHQAAGTAAYARLVSHPVVGSRKAAFLAVDRRPCVVGRVACSGACRRGLVAYRSEERAAFRSVALGLLSQYRLISSGFAELTTSSAHERRRHSTHRRHP